MYKCISKRYNFNNGHICKHTHRVHSIIQKKQLQNQQAESAKAEYTIQEDLGQQQCELTDNIEHPSLVYLSALLLHHSIQLQTFNTLQKDLQSHINANDNQIMPYIDHEHVLLHQAVATCKAAV